MNHDDLADALELERAQVEWAFTVFGIIQSLYDLSTVDRTQLLHGLCGSPPNPEFQLDWSIEYSDLLALSTDMDILRWLVLGLDDSSSVRITDLLEDIRKIQLQDTSESDDNHALPIEPPRLTMPQPHGVLIIRVKDLENEHWTYRIFNKEHLWSITDLNQESDVLTQILSKCQIPHSLPTALLCLEEDIPSVIDLNTQPSTFTNTSNERHLHGAYQHFQQSIQVDTPGDFQTDAAYSSSHFKCAWQLISQWKYTLKTIQGSEYPMVWNLQCRTHQSATGSAGSNGHVRLRNSAFIQILGDEEHLGGTSHSDDVQTFPTEMEQRVDSQHCVWQLPYSALDFKEHATHFNLDVEPIFNTSTTLNHHAHHLKYIRGAGKILQGQYFVEMMLQAIQSDPSRRTQISLDSQTSISITGDIEWCGHTIALTPLLESNSWSWIHDTISCTV